MRLFEKLSFSQTLLHCSCVLSILAMFFPTIRIYCEGETHSSTRDVGTAVGMLTIASLFMIGYLVVKFISKYFKSQSDYHGVVHCLFVFIYIIAFVVLACLELVLLSTVNLSILVRLLLSTFLLFTFLYLLILIYVLILPLFKRFEKS
jgi:uncharacterized BrkB/YihY/UPF0761 family membrane protein